MFDGDRLPAQHDSRPSNALALPSPPSFAVPPAAGDLALNAPSPAAPTPPARPCPPSLSSSTSFASTASSCASPWHPEASQIEAAAGVVGALPAPLPMSPAGSSRWQYHRDLSKFHWARNPRLRPPPPPDSHALRLGLGSEPPQQQQHTHHPQSDHRDQVQPGCIPPALSSSAPQHLDGTARAALTLTDLPREAAFLEPMSGGGPLSGDVSPLPHGSPHDSPQDSPRPRPRAFSPLSPKQVCSPHGRLPHMGPLTPPAEHGEPQWLAMALTPASPMPSVRAESASDHSNSPGAVAEPTRAQPPSPVDMAPGSPLDSGLGLDGAIHILRRNLLATLLPYSSLRVLSHTLPYPSMQGHALPAVMSAIHGSTPTSPTVWINVYHAVPGRFNLADLPSSPPATPIPALGGPVDYFTQKQFDSAVAVADYQEATTALPRSPRPAVQPFSLNVSIVERYIPPGSPNEFADMFDEQRPSILMDRLVELSPNNGTLIFIYPTKAGAQTFMRDHLGPILDPLLRSIVVVNGLSSDLSITLGRMTAVDQLPDYDTMRRQIERLCARLSDRSSEAERFDGRAVTFSLEYGSRYNVRLPRKVWANDWWTKQEKRRVRETMQRHVQDAQARANFEQAQSMGTPVALMQQLLEGVTRRAYPSDVEPEAPMEVGVFVITCTH